MWGDNFAEYLGHVMIEPTPAYHLAPVSYLLTRYLYRYESLQYCRKGSPFSIEEAE